MGRKAKAVKFLVTDKAGVAEKGTVARWKRGQTIT